MVLKSCFCPIEPAAYTAVFHIEFVYASFPTTLHRSDKGIGRAFAKQREIFQNIEFNEEVLAGLRVEFNAYDTDHSGTIDPEARVSICISLCACVCVTSVMPTQTVHVVNNVIACRAWVSRSTGAGNCIKNIASVGRA